MKDSRFQKSERAIKKTFLALLAEKQLVGITMSELSKRAGISRSTLYAHFGNVQEIYAELVSDFSSTLQTLRSLMRCQECHATIESGRPFCVALRDAGEYAPLVHDERFLSTFFNQVENAPGSDKLFGIYNDTLGLDELHARAVFRFQMSGCYFVAMSDVPMHEWESVQQTLDTFIRGGVNAIRVS